MASYDLTAKITDSRINPRALTRAGLEFVQARSDGNVAVVEGSNPVALMIEYGATMASATILAVENATRPLYRSAILTYRDLYRHMADKDYLDRFSTPAQGQFMLLLDMDEVLSKAVLVPNTNGIRKLVIPRYTSVIVEGMSFNLQYPIEIRVLPQNNLSVNYDLSIDSPFDVLESNRLVWRVAKFMGTTKLLVNIGLRQLALSTNYVNVNDLTGYRKEFAFSDFFYYARVFTRNNADVDWTEIRTSHSDDIYDPYVATASLRVLNGTLQVNIPQIYFGNGLIRDDLRVDIYTTKGDIDVDLEKLTSQDFQVRTMDSTEPLDLYSAPLQTMRSFKILSPYRVKGGARGLTFIELRNRVVNRGTNTSGQPITEYQLRARGAVDGFDIVKYVDNVTSRIFVATRDLPAPDNGDLVNGMDMTVLPWITRIIDEVDGDGVVKVGPIYVIKPKVLFEETVDGLKRVDQAFVNQLLDSVEYPPEALARAINDKNYLFTPFHYVIDTSSDRMRVNAYELDTPEVKAVDFVQENISLGIVASTLLHQVISNVDGTGYTLAVEMSSDGMPANMTASDIAAQLSYTLNGARRYIQGQLKGPIDVTTGKPVSGRWIFTFAISTRFDVDVNDRMSLGLESSVLPIYTEFDLVYVIKDFAPSSSSVTDIDAIVKAPLLTNYEVGSTFFGVSQEKLYVEFGQRLDRLWTRMRTIGGIQRYLTYPDDIPLLWTEDVYQTDATGLPVVTIDETSNTATAVKLHAIGDPVINDGVQAYLHRAGDFVLDADGKPIPDNGAIGQLREIDLFLLDASYRYADDTVTRTYYESCLDLLQQWIKNDLENINDRLIDQTQLFFHPKRNFGQVRVITGVGDPEVIRSEQRLSVVFDVTQAIFDNLPVRQAISDRLGRVIDEVLKNTVIAKTDIEIALKQTFNQDILSASISGLFEDKHNVVTVIDKSVRPVIGKRLVVTGTQSLRVVNDINVTFIPHRV